MKKIIPLIIILLISLFNGCNPKYFKLITTHPYDIEGKIVGRTENFKQINQNTFQLNDTVIIGLKSNMITNQQIKLLLHLDEKSQIRLSFRDFLHQFEPEESITLYLTEKDYTVKEADKIYTSGKLEQQDSLFLEFEDDGKKLKLKINCTDINLENMQINSTEYMIIENFSNSKALLSILGWTDLRDIENYKKNK